jgi:S1-C subfamily serine protease
MLEEGYNEDSLNVGDKITSIDGVKITSVSQISEIVREHKIGDTLTFLINRNKEEKTLTVRVMEHNPTK